MVHKHHFSQPWVVPVRGGVSVNSLLDSKPDLEILSIVKIMILSEILKSMFIIKEARVWPFEQVCGICFSRDSFCCPRFFV